MLIGITNKEEIKNLTKKLKEKFDPYIDINRNIRISYKTNSKNKNQSFDISYSNKLGIWWYFGEVSNRYWNCFGIDAPGNKPSLNITTEINIPFEGTNLRVSGIWAKDDTQNYYLLHNGGIRGGKKNIGKQIFNDNFNGEYVNVQIGSKVKEFAFVAQLNAENTSHQLAWFVKEIGKIKNLNKNIVSNKITQVKKQHDHGYSPEFHGTKKSYGLPERPTPNCDHGLIIDELRNILKKFTPDVYNKYNYIDLYTLDNNSKKINNIFELKTVLSRQNVYTAIGQLYLNSISENPKPRLIFVCPNDIDKDLIDDLQKMKIDVMTYKMDNKKPMFNNLKQIETLFNA